LILMVVIPWIVFYLLYRVWARWRTREPQEREEVGCFAVITVFLWLIAGVVIGYILASDSLPKYLSLAKPPAHDVRTSLVALRQRSDLDGSFFLGSGRIGTNHYYSYWYVDGPGFRHGLLRDGPNVLVVEDVAPESAYLQQNVIPASCVPDGYELWVLCGEPRLTDEYEFHIPPGSLLQEFELQ